MKKILCISFCVLCLTAGAVQARLTDTQKADCEKLLQVAEFKDADWIYDECGLNEEGTAWSEWAPVFSQKKYAKGLYQLCKRYPAHEYADLYCKKAADAGSLPALYALAQKAKSSGEDELFETYLLDIISKNNIQNKKQMKNFDDLSARQAYEDLAKFYYELQDEVKTKNVVPYLQIAAEAGSTTAASTLATFLYQMPQSADSALYEKYLWQAIMGGCPAAEENFGVISYEASGRIDAKDRKRLMDKHLFSCDASEVQKKPYQKLKTVQECACSEVLAWDKVQGHKPFLILGLSADNALLQDKDGMQYSVEVGEKVTGGYVVEEIRPTAVILRKTAERIILLYRDDSDCIELCKDDGKPKQIKGDDVPPYRLAFTAEECDKIAANIENLNNPLEPFRGVAECQLQDWKRWGQKALKQKRNKHLFLLANYEKSQYIPAYVARAELMFAQGGTRAYSKIEEVLKNALRQQANDELSQDRQEYAFCLEATLALKGQNGDKEQGFKIAEQGAKKGFAQSMNILGVAYANGFGVEKDLTKAEEWLLAAETASKAPFVDARRNYLLLQSGKDFNQMEFGNCEQIANPSKVTKEELLKLYQ